MGQVVKLYGKCMQLHSIKYTDLDTDDAVLRVLGNCRKDIHLYSVQKCDTDVEEIVEDES